MFQVLRVLMWKHCTVRRNRILSNIADIIPILLFLFVLLSKHDLLIADDMIFGRPILNKSDITSVPSLRTHLSPLNVARVPSLVMYSPDTDTTRALMLRVGRKLNMTFHEAVDSAGNAQFGLNKVPRDTFDHNIAEDTAVVIFEGMDIPGQPSKLVYTIRINQDFMTDTYKVDGNDDLETMGSIYEPFMRLQWAIDSSYIEMVSNRTLPKDILVERMASRRAAFAGKVSGVQPLCAMWSAIQTVVYAVLLLITCVSRMVTDRAGGLLELIKMSGVTTTAFGISHVLNMLPCMLGTAVAAAVALTSGDKPLIVGLSVQQIVVLILLTGLSMCSLAYLVCFFFTDPSTATSVVSLLSCVLFLLSVHSAGRVRGLARYTFAALPTVPVLWFYFNYIEKREVTDITRTYEPAPGSVMLTYVYLSLQSVVCFALAWYVEKVHPGQYGVALPWNFLFTKEYWFPSYGKEKSNEKKSADRHEEFFEPLPENAERAIRVINVSKSYTKMGVVVTHALRDVTLDVPRGEVTVLLGHNGAGKSTLMNIITGMCSATRGDVYVSGYHYIRERAKIRRHLGYCPQHNVFIDDLNVLQHVMFYSMLKGVPWHIAKASSISLLEKLNLEDKAHTVPRSLSGGMMRRLQLCGALAGGSDILILDEPSAGLDVETRRNLVDFILSLRGSRTVLLSTHYMDEAEALGDRVAALHDSRLRCHATPAYLKRAIGSGYRLTLVTKGTVDESKITSLIQSHVPSATLKDLSNHSMIYNLPAADSKKFPDMFLDLESKQESLNIDSIGVGPSTLEDVLMRLSNEEDTTALKINRSDIEPRHKLYSGPELYKRQFCALLMRRIKFTWYNRISFLILYVLFPLVMWCTFVYMFNDDPERKTVQINARRSMSLDLYHDIADPEDLARLNSDHRRSGYRRHFVNFKASDELVDAPSIQNITTPTIILGVNYNASTAEIQYSPLVRHSAPVALNLLSNILAAHYMPFLTDNDGPIVTMNHPLEDTRRQEGATVDKPRITLSLPKSKELLQPITMFVSCILAISSAFVSKLPIAEMVSGTREVHLMQGVPAAALWASALAHDAALYAMCHVTLAVLAMAIFEADHTIDEPGFLVASFVIFLLCGLTSMPFMYLIATLFTEKNANYIIYIMIIVCTCFIPSLMGAASSSGSVLSEALGTACEAFFWVPWQQLALAFGRAATTARLNAMCTLNRRRMCVNPQVPFDVEGHLGCCATSGNMLSYFSWREDSPAKVLAITVPFFFFYMFLLIKTDEGAFDRLRERMVNREYRQHPPAPRYSDPDALREKQYVKAAAAAANEGKMSEDAFLLQSLHKNFRPALCGKSVNPVRGVSFSVKKNECFGLLGVNGAGKSTIFRMITCFSTPTLGEMWCGGVNSKRQRKDFMHSLSYCPQAAGVDDFLSVRDNIRLVLTLRGLQHVDVAALADAWIRAVGLERVERRVVATYSGGAQRLSAAAAALASRASLALLDEPSAGVDLAARRRLWAALRTAPRATLLTSHSMEEVEALCPRMGIMCGGEMAALGSPAAIRAAHATGLSLRLKLLPDATPEKKAELREEVLKRFNCELKAENQLMMHFNILEVMPNSRAFTLLEQLREQYPVVEDFALSGTTLEEVFVALAKKQNAMQAAEQEPLNRKGY